MNASAELVPSISIANLCNQRAGVLAKLHQAFDLIQEASAIAGEANIGFPRMLISNIYGGSERSIAQSYIGADRRGARFEAGSPDSRTELEKLARVGVDAAAWQYLMHESGMRSLMDATARAKWDKSISEGDFPELNEANIRSTFGMLNDSRGEIFERGVIECFRKLSWHYKTNLPQKFGKRIVVQYLTGGYGGHAKCDQLDDLMRVFMVLDGKPEQDFRHAIYAQMSAAGLMGWPAKPGVMENEYLQVRAFKNHNGHVTFKRPDLVEKLNKIIARHYPGALPEPKQ